MKTMNIGISAAVILSTLGAFAEGQGVGNGGRGWVCYEKRDPVTNKRAIKSVELIDYVEARTLTTWNVNLGIDHPGVDDTGTMLNQAMTNLTRVDRWRAEQIRSRLDEMKTRSAFLDLEKDKVALSKIADSNSLIEPSDSEECVEKQVAFNKTDPNPMEFKYAFVKDYIEKMDDQNRAGLYLHEAVYNLEASAGASTSDASRELVRMFSSPKMNNVTPLEYFNISKNYARYPTVTDAYGSYSNVKKISDQGVEIGSALYDQDYEYVQLYKVGQTAQSIRVDQILAENVTGASPTVAETKIFKLRTTQLAGGYAEIVFKDGKRAIISNGQKHVFDCEDQKLSIKISGLAKPIPLETLHYQDENTLIPVVAPESNALYPIFTLENTSSFAWKVSFGDYSSHYERIGPVPSIQYPELTLKVTGTAAEDAFDLNFQFQGNRTAKIVVDQSPKGNGARFTLEKSIALEYSPAGYLKKFTLIPGLGDKPKVEKLNEFNFSIVDGNGKTHIIPLSSHQKRGFGAEVTFDEQGNVVGTKVIPRQK